MLKQTTVILIYLISAALFSQNLKVDYERIKYAKYDEGEDDICPTVLFLSPYKSIFLEDFLIEGKNSEVPLSEYRKGNITGGYIYGDSLGQIIIKNNDRKSFIQRRKFAGYDNNQNVYRIVKDSILPDFNWEITGETQQILGYSVQKAKTKFNNREIEAWFTTTIALSDGPWKFSGLPGLILKVKIIHNDDIFWTYEAVKITTIKEMPLIDFNKNLPEASLKEIENGYIKKYKNQYKYYQSKSSGEVKVRVDDLDFTPIIFPQQK